MYQAGWSKREIAIVPHGYAMQGYGMAHHVATGVRSPLFARALYLADGTARRVYDNMKESGYYAGVISANISQRLSIDSIRLDLAGYPYAFRCYGQETIVRTTSVVTRSLVTEGYLRNVSRSDNNPHGFLIERWTILENRDIKVEQR